MKEPKVHVGILFEPQIEFILLNPYRINDMEISGKQVVTYKAGKAGGGAAAAGKAGCDLQRRQDTVERTPL